MESNTKNNNDIIKYGDTDALQKVLEIFNKQNPDFKKENDKSIQKYLETNYPEEANTNTSSKLKEAKEEIELSIKLMNEIGNLYDELQKDPTNIKLQEKANKLEKKYYELTGFPVPFNRNNEIYTSID